ncbi:hypothetical protein CHUAL_007865 [Chamberlinius hualienensis]
MRLILFWMLLGFLECQADGKKMVPGCHEFKSGVTNSEKHPTEFTLYTQAVRDIPDPKPKSEIKCGRVKATFNNTDHQLIGENIYFNTTSNEEHKAKFLLSSPNSGVYTDNCEKITQVYTVLQIRDYGLYIYSCFPEFFNFIQFLTYEEKPKSIPWDLVEQQFKDFGFPGYQIVDQDLKDCTPYYK